MISRPALSTVVPLWAALVLISCATKPERHFNEDKIYADIIGFSDSVTNVPDLGQGNNFYHLTVNAPAPGELTQAHLIPHIQYLPIGKNTAVYYALDKALDRIEMVYKNKPPNAFSADRNVYSFTRYYIILFTDGLDNVSVQLARNNKKGNYANGEKYAAALRGRMERIVKGNGSSSRQNIFEIFLLGLRGEDLKESYSGEELAGHLRSLTAACNGVVHEPIVNADIDAIYEEFQNTFAASDFSFNVPKGIIENKYRVRMEFAAKGEEGFPHWFEADIKKKSPFSSAYVLANIRASPGFTFGGGEKVIAETPGRAKDSLSVQFTINDLKVFNAPLPIAKEQQLFLEGGNWRKNPEYESLRGRYKNAYVMLLMDRSDSMDLEERKDSEDMVINIINLLSGM
jgi:hypothetical protein